MSEPLPVKPQAEPRTESLSAFLQRTGKAPVLADIEYLERTLNAAVERAERAELDLRNQHEHNNGLEAVANTLRAERDAAVELLRRLVKIANPQGIAKEDAEAFLAALEKP